MVAPAAGFRADVAQRLTGISYRQLDYWDKTGLVRPSIRQARGKGSRRVYSFEDLVELRVVARMLVLGITLPNVRKAVRYLKIHYAHVTRPLVRLALIASGRSILMRADNPSRLVDVTAAGQLVLTIAVSPIARELEKNVTKLSAPREISIRVRSRSYKAVFTPDLEAGGYTVEVPALPGVVTEGDSLADARRMTADAIRLWLDSQERERSGRKRGAR